MGYLENRFFRYLIPCPKDKDWGLYITDAGRTQIPPHTDYPPPGHPKDYHFSINQGRILHTFQVVYITQGSGIFQSKRANNIPIEEGCIFLLFPNVWHSYWPKPETGWNEHWIGFNGDYANRLQQKGFFKPEHPFFNIGYDESLICLFDNVIELIRNEPIGYQQTISAYALEILSKLNSINPSHKEMTYIQTVTRKAKSLIVERMSENIDMAELASSLGVSYSWFRWAFKHYTGFSPHKYLLELRIEKAKFLLKNSSESIKTISNLLGFESPYYFSRLFKKKTGVNPRQWRQKPVTTNETL